MLPRATTSGERAAIRADGQWTELYLIIPSPASVYTARVNGAPASTDQLTTITFDGGSGTLADVLPGMTVWIGSSAGAYDRGQARIRKAPISGTFYIGTESEIDVQDNDYLTVVDEFGLWQRPVRAVSASEAYMDYDVAYSDQHTDRLPVVLTGGPAVVDLVGGLAVATFDASDSWEPGGGSPTFSWDAPTADGIDDDTSATPAITFSSAGRHRVSCTVTIDGQANTRYEYVYVLGPGFAATTQFRLTHLSGSKAEGGYTFGLTLYAEATLTAIRDRAQVLLCERVRSGGQPAALGYATGRENVLAVGWIAGETLEWSPDLASVSFQVEGAQAWLSRITAYPQGLEDTGGETAASAWTNYSHLTVTAMLWHLLTWRSTVAQALDCYVEASTLRAVELSAVASTLWEQITTIAGIRLLAAPCCDCLSRLFIQIDAQYRADDARTGVAEVHTLTPADWQPPLRITRATVTEACQVDLSGVGYDGTDATAYFSLAPGRTFRRFGRVRSQQSLLIADQDHANTLAGLVAGQANNPYPLVAVSLAGRLDRFLDIAPDCYVRLAVAAGDTPRGVSFSRRLLVRRIEYSWDGASGSLLSTLEGEAETFETLAVTGDAPPAEPEPPPSDPPDEPEEPPPTPGEGTGDLVYVVTTGKIMRTRDFLSASPTWEDITGAASGTFTAFILDPWDPKNSAYLLSTATLYYCADLDSASPTWTSVLTASAVATAKSWSSVTFAHLASPITAAGRVCVGGRSTSSSGLVFASVTDDYGGSWTHTAVTTGLSGDSADYGVRRVIADLATAGTYYLLQGPSNRGPGIKATYDNGATWNYVGSGYGGAFQRLYCFEIGYDPSPSLVQQYWYVQEDFHQIYASSDYGVNFSDKSPGGATNPSPEYGRISLNAATADQQDIMFADPRENVGLDQSVHIFRSYDGGATWPVNIDTDLRLIEALGRWPYDPERVFLLGHNGSTWRIYYSANGGVTLQDKTGNWAAEAGGAFTNGVMIVPVWVN